MLDVEKILADLETKTLKAKLREMPALLIAQKRAVAEKYHAADDAKNALRQVEAEIKTEIAAEVGENGKPKFSNETAREAEFIRRRAANQDYQAAEASLREAQMELNEAQWRLEELQDSYKSYRHVVDLTARELSLLSTGAANEVRVDTGAMPETVEAAGSSKHWIIGPGAAERGPLW